MAQARCPECGAAAAMAARKAYCPRCGWNRDAAEKKLRRLVRVLPAIMVACSLFGIIVFGLFLRQWLPVILLVTLPTLILGGPYTNAQQKLRQIQMQKMGAGGEEESEAESPAGQAQTEVAGQKTEQNDFLLSLPPPRPVRLRVRGKIAVFVVIVAACGTEVAILSTLYAMRAQGSRTRVSHAPEIFLTMVALAIVFLPFFVLQMLSRDRELLENGALAMGRVTGQRQVKSSSSITYEFADATGKKIAGSGADFTHTIFEGMTVAVFYDPQNPARNVAVCSSFREVVPPGGS